MTKSKKKQAGAKQIPAKGDEFGRNVEIAFSDHPWPASRTELLEHASRQGTFAKSDLARLKQIPHRDYHSVADLMDATRLADASMSRRPDPVATTAEHNRRAMGDSTGAYVSSAAPYDEQAR